MNLPKFLFLLFLFKFVKSVEVGESSSGAGGNSAAIERGQPSENGNNPSASKGVLDKNIAKISNEESEKLVEKILNGGPLIKIKFFEKIVDGNQKMRDEIAEIMLNDVEKERDEFSEKEAKRSSEEIEKIKTEIRNGLLPKFEEFVEKIIEEKDLMKREKLITNNFMWKYVDEEGKENFKAKLGEYDENEDYRRNLANLLIDHSIGPIVAKFEGSTSKLMQRLIHWFVSRSKEERKNAAEIVANENAESRKEYLVEFFTLKMRSDIIEEMEKREKDIFNPEKMTWQKAVEIVNYERYFGHNADKLREQEIRQMVDEIVEGNAYQRIHLFYIIGNDCAECVKERPKIANQLTDKNGDSDKYKLIKNAGKRTKGEKDKLDEQIKKEMLEMKKYFLRKYIRKRLFPPKDEEEAEEEEDGNGLDEVNPEDGKREEEDEIMEVEESLEQREEERRGGGKEEEKREEKEQKKDIKVRKEKYKFLRKHFRVFQRRNPGLIPYRRGGKQDKWVEEARKFGHELDKMIKELKEKIRIENVEENDENIDGILDELMEPKIKEKAPKMMTEKDVKFARREYIESTKEFHEDLVKDFIEWLQKKGIEKKKIIEGTKEERKQLIGDFVKDIKKMDLIAKIMAKTAYGLRVDHEYMEKLVSKEQYLLPPDMKGFVINHKDVLRSTNAGIDKLLQYVQIKANNDMKKAEEKFEELKTKNAKYKKEQKAAYYKKDLDTIDEEETEKSMEKKDFEDKKKLFEKLKELLLQIPSKEERGCFLRLRISHRMRHYAYLFDEAVTIPQNRIEDFLGKFDDEKRQNFERGAAVTPEELEEFMENIEYKREKKEEKKNIYMDDEEEEEEEEEDDEKYTQITTHILIEIIKKGKKALGPKTELSWPNLPQVENKLRTTSKMWQKVVAFFKFILEQFIAAKKYIQQNIKKALANPREFGKWLGKKAVKILSKDRKARELKKDADEILEKRKMKKERENKINEKKKMLKKGTEQLKEMRHSKFVKNDEPHARLIQQKADTFEFLRQVRYEFEASSGNDVDKRKLYKMIEEKEDEIENDQPEEPMEKKSKLIIWKILRKNNGKKKHIPIRISQEEMRKYEVCDELRRTIDAVMYPQISSELEAQQDPIHFELRGRLGANILLSIMNTKKLTREMLTGLGLSLAGSGLVALIVDVGFIALITFFATLLGPVTGGASLIILVPVVIIIRSTVPLLAETFDSFVIKRLLGLNRGLPFWPKSRKELEQNIREALLAGGISAVGSVPFNIFSSLSFFAGWAWLPLKAIANFIGTSTSAAMVPIEVEKMGGHTGASILIKIEEGFLAVPNQEKIVKKYELRKQKEFHLWKKSQKPSKDEEDKAWKSLHTRAMQSYVQRKTRRTMRIAKASALAMSSMGVGATISFFFGFLIFAIPSELGWLPESMDSLVEVASILFNTPTEAISMATQAMTGEKVGLTDEQKVTQSRENHIPRKWLSRDSTKNRQMMQLVFNKTFTQLENNAKNNNDLFVVNIKYKELHNIYRPLLTFTSPFGEWITNVLKSLFMFTGLIKDLLENVDVTDLKERALKNSKTSGLIDEAEMVVKNWRENMIYLIQRPRTSSSPSLAPSDLKMETWLKFRKIPFYRLTNARFLAALFNEQLPIIEFRGEQIIGSVDEIIRELEFKMKEAKVNLGDPEAVLDVTAGEFENKEKAKELENKEMEMRKLVDRVLNRILTYDRQYYIKNEEEENEEEDQGNNIKMKKRRGFRFKPKFLHRKNLEKSKQNWKERNGAKALNFVLEDEAIFEQLKEEYNQNFVKKLMKTKKNFIQSKIDLDGAVDTMRLRLQIYRLEPDDNEFIKSLRKQKKKNEFGEVNVNNEENGENKLLTYKMLDADEIVELAKRTMEKIEKQLTETEENLHKHNSPKYQNEIASTSENKNKLYLFGNLPTQADASLFAHLVLFKHLNIPAMKEYFNGIMADGEHILRRYVDQIKEDQWGGMDPGRKLNYDIENEWSDGKISEKNSFHETKAPFDLLPDDIEPAEESMEKETPRELAQIEIKKEEEKKKHWWNFMLNGWRNIFKRGEKKNIDEANKNKEIIVDELEVVEEEELPKLKVKMNEKFTTWDDDKNDRIHIERFWARELTNFEHLPLPKLDNENVNKLAELDLKDFSLQNYPPLLIPIIEKLYKIGNEKYSPNSVDEKHSSKLMADINGLFQKYGNKNETSRKIIRTMLRLMAAYLCKDTDNANKQKDKAAEEFHGLHGYHTIGHLELYEGLKIFLWHEIFKFNEEEIKKQLQTLGKSLVRNVKNTNEKIKKWRHPGKITPKLKKVTTMWREWLVEKVVKMLASKDNVAEKYAEADEKEEMKAFKKENIGNPNEEKGGNQETGIGESQRVLLMNAEEE